MTFTEWNNGGSHGGPWAFHTIFVGLLHSVTGLF